MTAISIFDITDELLDQIAPARPITYTEPEPEPAIIPKRKIRKPAEPVIRRCSCCGIDTTLPDMCWDCTEAGYFS